MAKLRPAQDQFIEEYLNNGGNAVKAYLASHPGCKSYAAAGVEGSRALNTPHIAEEIRKRHRARLQRMQMDGDEAMALIAAAARADIAQVYDVTGSVLPVHEWPFELRMAVREVRGDGTVKLVDPLRARELVAQAEGKIKNRVDVAHTFDHAAFLADLTPASGGTK